MKRLILLPVHAIQRVRSCLASAVFFLLLLLLAGCALLAFVVGRASAAGPEPSVVLVVDQSNSMWEQSDPAGLRVEAAELIIAQLGVDERVPYRLGVVLFGSEAQLQAPLTPLDDAAARRTLAQSLREAEPMGWTDTHAALALAQEALPPRDDPAQQRAVLLLTDGRPEIEGARSGSAEAAYRQALVEQLRQMTGAGVGVHVVLLATTESALAEVELWWIEASAATPGVHLHRAAQADELVAIYHAIAATLRGTRSVGAVVEGEVAEHAEHTIEVEAGLAEVTLLIQKEEEELNVVLGDPAGEIVVPRAPDVQVVREGSTESWLLRQPTAGTWTVRLDGSGEVTIWQEVRRASPTPTTRPSQTPLPSETAAAPASTSSPLETAMAPATRTPAAVAVASSEPPAGGTGSPPERGRSPLVGGLILLAAVGLVAVGGRAVVGVRRPTPLLDGTLRLMAGPGGSAKGQRWPLDPLGRARITIGGADGDIPLTEVTGPPLTLVAQTTDTGIAPTLQPHSNGRVNDRPLTTPQALWDRDDIQLGPYRLRYENVRRRKRSSVRAFER